MLRIPTSAIGGSPARLCLWNWCLKFPKSSIFSQDVTLRKDHSVQPLCRTLLANQTGQKSWHWICHIHWSLGSPRIKEGWNHPVTTFLKALKLISGKHITGVLNLYLISNKKDSTDSTSGIICLNLTATLASNWLRQIETCGVQKSIYHSA